MTKFKMETSIKVLYLFKSEGAIISILESWKNTNFMSIVNSVFLWICQVGCSTTANTATLLKKAEKWSEQTQAF